MDLISLVAQTTITLPQWLAQMLVGVLLVQFIAALTWAFSMTAKVRELSYKYDKHQGDIIEGKNTLTVLTTTLNTLLQQVTRVATNHDHLMMDIKEIKDENHRASKN